MKREYMKFVFIETGEIFHYRHVVIEGLSAILVTRCKGSLNEESRYYNPNIIEEGLSRGAIKLLGEFDSE
jgi:hypothetical protein